MKKTTRSAVILMLLALAVMFVFPMSSCGSELDGTWRSRSDEDTRIRIAGEKVRITYDRFRIDGTYELDEDDNITFHLTDKNGVKFKIVAKLSADRNHRTITLTNSKGESEVFEKK